MGEAKPTMIAETSRTVMQRQVQQERSVTVPPVVGLKRLRYRAVWRSKQLLILPVDCHPFRKSVSAVLEDDRDRLLICLKHSTVKRVLLSPKLALAELQLWAELCQEANLPVYIRLTASLSNRRSLPLRLLFRLLNIAGASALLFLCSPVMLLAAGGSVIKSGRVFRRYWTIGNRGLLFQSLSFDSIDVDFSREIKFGMPTLAKHLQFLPILLNILIGETAFSLLNLSLNLENEASFNAVSKYE